jgi:ADP-ribose pyrophosphatase YjhB (NUDIX family)
MYKVFINDKFIQLTDEVIPDQIDDNMIYLTYGDFEELHYVITLLENAPLLQGVIFHHPDLELLWADFRAHYREIDAGGGLVRNGDNQILFIRRLGKWDLPKGKLDADERPEAGALREVEEECSVHDLRVTGDLPVTYHAYEEKGVRHLKRTFWYEMRSDQVDFIPQTEEGIDRVEWKELDAESLTALDTYPSIRLLLKAVIGQS